MRQKFFTLFLSLVASIGIVFADKVKIGDLYYNLNTYEATAQVTWQNNEQASIESALVFYNNYPNLTTVNIPSEVKYEGIKYTVTSIGFAAFRFSELTSVIMPNTLTTIGAYAFFGCTNLTEIVIPNSVRDVNDCAFYTCNGTCVRHQNIVIGESISEIGLYGFFGMLHGSVVCYAPSVPKLNYCGFDTNGYSVTEGSDTFDATLYVLPSLVNAYKNAENWKEFPSIKPIQLTKTTVTDANATPDGNNVIVSWPIVENAIAYELEIKNKQTGDVICSLRFDVEGELVSYTFHAPAKQTAENGYMFTVTGLELGSDYTYSVTATNSTDDVIKTYSGDFSIADIVSSIQSITNDQLPISYKVIKDGQILILRGDKTYTLTGAEVK